MPPDHISLTFLGTAAGRPSPSRNVSALAIKLDARVWVVDAGESTQHQFMDKRCRLSMAKVDKIFITHMHADHVNGLPGLLCTISAGEGSVHAGEQDPRVAQSQSIPPTQIYGPSGLRLFLRTCLALTHSTLTRPYQVNELLFPDERPEDGTLHPSERQGRDIRCDRDGFWRGVVDEHGMRVDVGPILHTVRCLGYLFVESARPLPIVPSLYIPHLTRPANAAALRAQGISNPMTLLSTLQTSQNPVVLPDGTVLTPPAIGPRGRRILVLGDTYDASPLLPLVTSLPPDDDDDDDDDEPSSSSFADDDPAVVASPSPSQRRRRRPRPNNRLDLVVHESTNAFLPLHDPAQAPSRRPNAPTLESVTELARAHGHSTPQVAGRFARSTGGTDRLVLNHLSVKYPDPGDNDESENGRVWRGMLREIERQAEEELFGGPRDDAAAEREGTTESTTADWRVKTARDFMEIEVPRRDKARGKSADKKKKEGPAQQKKSVGKGK
ncbi:hypothetical protein JCM11491_000562 [Sporobolomyces phaffii]